MVVCEIHPSEAIPELQGFLTVNCRSLNLGNTWSSGEKLSPFLFLALFITIEAGEMRRSSFVHNPPDVPDLCISSVID